MQESRSAQYLNQAIEDLSGLGVDARRQFGRILPGAQSPPAGRPKQ
jgi:hypothetical protein